MMCLETRQSGCYESHEGVLHWGGDCLEKPNCRILSLNAVKCQVMCKSA